MLGDDIEERKITGLMFYYYWVCKRKLWYFYHEISMEHTNENVEIGKLLDEDSFSRENKHINIDNVINIDFIKEYNILHEVKKSRAIEEAGIWQIKYYLFYLKQRGITDIKGKVDYPLLHQSIKVELSEDDEKVISEVLLDINEIVKRELPPEYKKSSICKKCAYFDLCAI